MVAPARTTLRGIDVNAVRVGDGHHAEGEAVAATPAADDGPGAAPPAQHRPAPQQ